MKTTAPSAANTGRLIDRAPTGRELANTLAAEQLEALRRMHETTTELTAKVAGMQVNSVLQHELVKLDTSGQASRQWHVPMGSAFVANYNGSDVTIATGGAGASAPGFGNGIARIPAGTWQVVNLAGPTLTIYGAAGGMVGIQVFSKSQPPCAGPLFSSLTTPVPLTGADQAITIVPATYTGFSIRETSGAATATVRILDSLVAGAGTVLDEIALSAGESAREYYEGGQRALVGIFVDVISGAVAGSIRVAS
jgi:hypothetical protein